MAKGNNPWFSLWSFVLQVLGLWNSCYLTCSWLSTLSAHTHMLTPGWGKEEWSLQRGDKVRTICSVCKRETFRLIQELDWVRKRQSRKVNKHAPKLSKENNIFVFSAQNIFTLLDIFPWKIYESIQLFLHTSKTMLSAIYFSLCLTPSLQTKSPLSLTVIFVIASFSIMQHKIWFIEIQFCFGFPYSTPTA